MKKLRLTPTKDSITICLPADWVGRPICCILEQEDVPNLPEAHEEGATYSSTSSHFEDIWESEAEDELWKDI